MARQLKPQRTTPPTPNDVRQALSSVDSLVVCVERLLEWKKEVESQETNNHNEIVSAFEKQFENLFNRLNRLEAKIKEIDKKVSGKNATASPLKVSDNGGNDGE